ncbi:MAG: universal stress protein [Desulfuromonadaceae bacterium]
MKILVPIREGRTSDATLNNIIAHQEQFSAPITLLHVVNVKTMNYRMIPDFQIEMIKEQATKAGQKLLDAKCADLHAAGVEVTARLEHGYPRDVICAIANNEDFSLLVIGRHERGEIRDVLLGSVSNYVLHKVKCPVLLF